MFVHFHTVQLHETDAYGIIFFANQFRFCHDTFQSFLAHVGHPLPHRREQVDRLLVIVHAECDYQSPIHVGDQLTLRMSIQSIGATSMIVLYDIHNQDGVQVGKGKTVHVTIDPRTSQKKQVPDDYRLAFAPYVLP